MQIKLNSLALLQKTENYKNQFVQISENIFKTEFFRTTIFMLRKTSYRQPKLEIRPDQKLLFLSNMQSYDVSSYQVQSNVFWKANRNQVQKIRITFSNLRGFGERKVFRHVYRGYTKSQTLDSDDEKLQTVSNFHLIKLT